MFTDIKEARHQLKLAMQSGDANLASYLLELISDLKAAAE